MFRETVRLSWSSIDNRRNTVSKQTAQIPYFEDTTSHHQNNQLSYKSDSEIISSGQDHATQQPRCKNQLNQTILSQNRLLCDPFNDPSKT